MNAIRYRGRIVQRIAVVLGVVTLAGYVSNWLTRPRCEADLINEISELTNGDI